MKVAYLFWGLLVILMAGCGGDDTIIDNPTFTVSSETVRNGDRIILKQEPGERTNVNLEVTFSWEDREIGSVDCYPYQLEYVVDGVDPGFHILTCTASYSKKKGGSQSSGTVVKNTLIQVIG